MSGFSGYEWRTNANGNLICFDSGGSLVATVFQGNTGGWQIAITGNVGAPFVAEVFDDPDAATEQAEAILDGAICEFMAPRAPAPDKTDWKQQTKRVNGQPTYGRRLKGLNASVRMAESGMWYFVTYDKSGNTRKPNEWFGTAQQAMAAFDRRHG